MRARFVQPASLVMDEPSTGGRDPQKEKREGRSASFLLSFLVQTSIMKFFAAFLAVLLMSIVMAQDNVESTTAGAAGLLAACADAKNPFSGVSNCPLRVSLCKLAEYETEMKRDCPKTCGFC